MNLIKNTKKTIVELIRQSKQTYDQHYFEQNKKTLRLSIPAECPLESFPVKRWPVKPLPRKQGLNFPPPQYVLHNLA